MRYGRLTLVCVMLLHLLGPTTYASGSSGDGADVFQMLPPGRGLLQAAPTSSPQATQSNTPSGTPAPPPVSTSAPTTSKSNGGGTSTPTTTAAPATEPAATDSPSAITAALATTSSPTSATSAPATGSTPVPLTTGAPAGTLTPPTSSTFAPALTTAPPALGSVQPGLGAVPQAGTGGSPAPQQEAPAPGGDLGAEPEPAPSPSGDFSCRRASGENTSESTQVAAAIVAAVNHLQGCIAMRNPSGPSAGTASGAPNVNSPGFNPTAAEAYADGLSQAAAFTKNPAAVSAVFAELSSMALEEASSSVTVPSPNSPTSSGSSSSNSLSSTGGTPAAGASTSSNNAAPSTSSPGTAAGTSSGTAAGTSPASAAGTSPASAAGSLPGTAAGSSPGSASGGTSTSRGGSTAATSQTTSGTDADSTSSTPAPSSKSMASANSLQVATLALSPLAVQSTANLLLILQSILAEPDADLCGVGVAYGQVVVANYTQNTTQSLAVASGLVAAAFSLPSSNSQVAECMLKTMAANMTVSTTTLQRTDISCPSIVTIFGLAFNVAGQLSNQDLFTTVLTISSNEVRQDVSTDPTQLNGVDELLNCTGLAAPGSAQTLISTQSVSAALLWDAGNATAPLT